MYICIYVNIYIYVCIYIYTYMCMYMYMYMDKFHMIQRYQDTYACTPTTDRQAACQPRRQAGMHTCTLNIRMPMWGYSWDIESASNMPVRVCPRIGYTTQNGNSDSLMRRMIIIRWMEWGTHFVAKPTCLTLLFPTCQVRVARF